MKILYIGHDAKFVARSLRGITQNVPLRWAQSLDSGATYLAQNRDLAALVIDASIYAGKWPASLKDLRSLPLRPAIVVVVPQGTRPTFDSEAPTPDDYVINGQTFSDDLPMTVSRSVARVRGSQTPSTPANTPEQPKPRPVKATPDQTVDALFLDATPTAPSELEQKLARLTAAFQQAERRHTAAMAAAQAAHELAATELLTGQEHRFQGQMALEQDKRRTIEEMHSAAASAREEAERRCASALIDAAAVRRELERISTREAELVAQSQRERALRAALEQTIESAAADVARLTRRETDLSEQLATVHSELLTVQGHLSDAVREVEETRESAAREHAAAETRLELTLAREREARETLERKLDEIRSAAADVERALRDEAASLRAQAVERQGSFDAQLERLNADLSDARRVLDVTRREFQEACDRQTTEHATAVAALAAQIAERDERLREAALRHDAAQHASERARAELQQSLQTALDVGRHDIDQVQQALMATLEAVRATRLQQDMLQTKADRLAETQEQQLESRATNSRVVQQPDIAAWQQLTKDPALV